MLTRQLISCPCISMIWTACVESLPPEKSAANFTTLHAKDMISMLCRDQDSKCPLGGDLFISTAIPIGDVLPEMQEESEEGKVGEPGEGTQGEVR